MHLEEPPKLIQPRDHKAKIQIWADLTVSDMDLVMESQTVDSVKRELVRIFDLDDYKENMKSAILLDLYYYAVQFAKDNNFTKEQTSAFFSIIKRLHEMAVETPFGNVDQCFQYFRELVLCHAVKRPPYSIDLFEPEVVRKITEYVINTYFRHFKMYKYVFTPLVRLDLSMKYNGMPPTPEPSEVGDADGEDAVGEEEGDGEDGERTEGQDGDTETGDQAQPEEESAAAKELRSIIKQHLQEEVGKLRISVDDQIKQSEENLNKKLEASEGGGPGKTGRASGKGKKK